MLIEGAIRIEIPDNCSGERFDGPDHGMSHCMKAVDFIIETPKARIFLEVKDPDAAQAPDTSLEYARRLMTGSLDRDLAYKYRDSWLYHYANDKLSPKMNYYFVLIGLSTISTESLFGRTLSLEKKVSIDGPKAPWARPYLDRVIVFNIESWNRNFPQFRVTRSK